MKNIIIFLYIFIFINISFVLGQDENIYRALAIDAENNTIIVPYCENTNLSNKQLDKKSCFDFSNFTISKYDKNGHSLWNKNIEAIGSYIIPTGVATDEKNNIYINGYFGKTEDEKHYDIEKNEYKSQKIVLSKDPVIIKLSAEGKYLWAVSIAASQERSFENSTWDIAVDKNGFVYVLGFMVEIPKEKSKKTSKKDLFLSKYNSSGEHIWSMGMGGTGIENAKGIALDKSGFIYLLGDSNKKEKDNVNEVFFANYTKKGKLTWAFNIGNVSNIKSEKGNIRVDAEGNLYLTEGFKEEIRTPQTANYTMIEKKDFGDNDLVEYDEMGNINSAFGIEKYQKNESFGQKVINNKKNTIYITGWFKGDKDNYVTKNSFDIQYEKTNEKNNYIATYNNGQIIWINPQFANLKMNEQDKTDIYDKSGNLIPMDKQLNNNVIPSSFSNINNNMNEWKDEIIDMGDLKIVPENILLYQDYPLYENHSNNFENVETKNTQHIFRNIRKDQMDIPYFKQSEYSNLNKESIILDASNLPKGIYLYQIKTTAKSNDKRMILLR